MDISNPTTQMSEAGFREYDDTTSMTDNTPYVETQPKFDGFFADLDDASCTVKVAVRIRPLIGKELREGDGQSCIQTSPDLGKLQIGTKEFCFDQVFDPERSQTDLYETTAFNLVLSCFNGYNATILAYG